MTFSIECDLSRATTPLPHIWEHTVGSGHAALALRADWQAQLLRCHHELGFRHVRFHGMLDDDMGTLTCQRDRLLYSFFNADQICDFLLSIGMRPFVELSFMPTALASGSKAVMHYRGNVTPPEHYEQWVGLIHALVSHWIDRYGRQEVSQWLFEVWNEPNIKPFWTGSQANYFRLYRETATAVKSLDSSFQVGGPATAKNEWIAEFIAFCQENDLPVDFISTHHYPTDAFGNESNDTEKQLAHSTRGALREQARTVRRNAQGLPIYYTEWNTSSDPRDRRHDESYAAAFIVKTVLEAVELVDCYSFWTFSDIFEENYFPSEPFHGGFGLLNLHGIAKPSYRAFQILHGLGHQQWSVEGKHPTVDAWVTQRANGLAVILTNQALPEHAIACEEVRICLKNGGTPRACWLMRIDSDHANPKQTWQRMGSPRYLANDQVQELNRSSELVPRTQSMTRENGCLRFHVTLPPQSIAAVMIDIGNPAGQRAVKGPTHRLDDETLLELGKHCAMFFLKQANPLNGLVPDNTRQNSPASVSATGFALAAYITATEQGLISRAEAQSRTLATLRFFQQSPQGPQPDATGYQGFYYHFLDRHSGRRAWDCELSTIDSTILFAGILAAGQYFNGETGEESEIRTLSQQLYERVNWNWAIDNGFTVSHGWRPGSGFLDHRWSGYSEALLLYILGLGSPTRPLPADAYGAWTETYDWKDLYGREMLNAGPFFIHQLSHCWIDFRGIQDGPMRAAGSDYFENSRRATIVQREYAIRNPGQFEGYGADCWGITASDGPGPATQTVAGRSRQFFGYAARGVPFGPDDGTVSLWCTLAALPFEPQLVAAAFRNMSAMSPGENGPYGLKSSFNLTFRTESGSPWISDHHFGINQGPALMMIENYRSGLFWKLLRSCPSLVRGLREAGFQNGWLE